MRKQSMNKEVEIKGKSEKRRKSCAYRRKHKPCIHTPTKAHTKHVHKKLVFFLSDVY